jgi:hypothetical protein
MPTRGFITIAQNSDGADYIRMAYVLAMSIRATQKYPLSVCVEDPAAVPERYRWAFDHIIRIPFGDDAAGFSWKVQNKWKYIHMSPYDQSIALDADMLMLDNLEEWWNAMDRNGMSVRVSSRAFNFRGFFIGREDSHRRAFYENDLPNAHTAVMYFNKSQRSWLFFQRLERIFKHWREHYTVFCRSRMPDRFSGDMACAIAMFQEGIPESASLEFTHMRAAGQAWGNDDDRWTAYSTVSFNPSLRLKINAHLQVGAFHYIDKDFLTDRMVRIYEHATHPELRDENRLHLLPSK